MKAARRAGVGRRADASCSPASRPKTLPVGLLEAPSYIVPPNSGRKHLEKIVHRIAGQLPRISLAKTRAAQNAGSKDVLGLVNIVTGEEAGLQKSIPGLLECPADVLQPNVTQGQHGLLPGALLSKMQPLEASS